VLFLALALGGGGCANGGGDTGSGGGDDGSPGDVTVEGGEAGGCTGGKTMCGSTCTDTGNDPKNCGKCGNACPKGQVCSVGMCGYSCSPPQTLCGLPPEGGTGMDATGGADTGTEDATSGDTGASEAGTVDSGGGTTDSGGGATDAGGATTPYCANLNNDPNNCGGCGNVCPPMYVCNSASCELMCGAGTVACPTTGTCIPAGTCCSTGDCTVAGEICTKPGGSCVCPGGERECTKSNSCISSNDCCIPTDCTVSGSTCMMPGQACTCASAGYKACIAFNACLPDADCCIPADCTAANVKTYSCTPSPAPPQTPTSSACGIVACDAGCYDLDKQYPNGCECCDDTVGKSCAAATALGSLSLGAAAITRTGVLPVGNEGDWFQVTFNSESNVAFHGLIQLTTGGGEYIFDVIQGSCSGGPLNCGEGGGCTGKTAWEESYAGLTWVAGNPPAEFIPIPAVGAVWIHVYRANTAMTSCNPYTLSVQE
jgi:hypothetical protein